MSCQYLWTWPYLWHQKCALAVTLWKVYSATARLNCSNFTRPPFDDTSKTFSSSSSAHVQFSLPASLLLRFLFAKWLPGWPSVVVLLLSDVTSSKCCVDVLVQLCTLYHLTQPGGGGTRSLRLPWGVPAATTLGFLRGKAPTLWDAPTAWWTTRRRSAKEEIQSLWRSVWEFRVERVSEDWVSVTGHLIPPLLPLPRDGQHGKTGLDPEQGVF